MPFFFFGKKSTASFSVGKLKVVNKLEILGAWNCTLFRPSYGKALITKKYQKHQRNEDFANVNSLLISLMFVANANLHQPDFIFAHSICF